MNPVTAAEAKRKWYGLALRHLRVASRLRRRGFPDAAFFHSCHAYDCVLSALIAAKGHPVPPRGSVQLGGKTGYRAPSGATEVSTHKARALLFDELGDRTKPYFSIHLRLRRYIPVQVRNDALYYDEVTDTLPHQRYKGKDAQAARSEVLAFAKAVWKAIR